ncbi:hypothetical protein [Streptomyces sp. 8N706]|uniref:hypothetical protein n=1 Tax=Streptomyces sp. 8N706 TaxID=3457416 RepID=UPI003FD149C9
MDSMDEVPEQEMTDHYPQALEQIAAAKLECRELEPPPEPEAAARPVVDLMAALEESVRKTQQARGGQPKEAGGRKSTVRKAKEAAAKRPGKRADPPQPQRCARRLRCHRMARQAGDQRPGDRPGLYAFVRDRPALHGDGRGPYSAAAPQLPGGRRRIRRLVPGEPRL